MKSAPKKLFFERKGEGMEKPFAEMHEKMASIPCQGRRVRVAIYQLVQEVEITSEPKIIVEIG